MVKLRHFLRCSIVLVGCLLLLAACGGGGDGSPSASSPTPAPTATPPATPAPPLPTPTPPQQSLTEFLQLVPAQDLSGEVFPGSANIWDLDWDFTLYNGYDDQFNGALLLTVTVEGNAEDFPFNQSYGELTWHAPEITGEDGAVIATILDGSNPGWQPLSDNYSAILAPGTDNRISQVIDLTNAAVPIYLNADIDYASYPGWIELPAYSARMVVRDLDGSELTATDIGGVLELTDYAGMQVEVSFELVSQTYGYFVVDDVSVQDGNSNEYINDGGFESGTLDNWTVSNAPIYQNVTSGARVLNGLTVTRSFYTAPGSLWGRWVDMFTNPTGTAIAATIDYTTNLGAGDFAIIYHKPSVSNRALTIWDGANSTRDVGLAFGEADEVVYSSDTAPGDGNGSDTVTASYTVTVPPGGSVAIANFIVMSGIDTGETALDASATADEVDGALEGIVNGFWAPGAPYRDGMAQAQIDALINFPQD